MARSPSSGIKDPLEFRAEIERLSKQLRESQDGQEREKLAKALDNRYKGLDRSVAVYGMIALRTDRRRVLITQKLEKQRRKGQKWDLYRLEPDAEGKLQYVSKHLLRADSSQPPI
ncbi:MAG: hypothetical protein JSV68_11995 [Anaerolineaceae bacterium]|nr:MAG: hypothetical protein JSV68_11995 [Anaerolineaceae bacterium]